MKSYETMSDFEAKHFCYGMQYHKDLHLFKWYELRPKHYICQYCFEHTNVEAKEVQPKKKFICVKGLYNSYKHDDFEVTIMSVFRGIERNCLLKDNIFYITPITNFEIGISHYMRKRYFRVNSVKFNDINIKDFNPRHKYGTCNTLEGNFVYHKQSQHELTHHLPHIGNVISESQIKVEITISTYTKCGTKFKINRYGDHDIRDEYALEEPDIPITFYLQCLYSDREIWDFNQHILPREVSQEDVEYNITF